MRAVSVGFTTPLRVQSNLIANALFFDGSVFPSLIAHIFAVFMTGKVWIVLIDARMRDEWISVLSEQIAIFAEKSKTADM